MKGLEFALSGDFRCDLRTLEEFLGILEVDFVLIPDNALGKPSVSSVVGATMIAHALGITTIATISGSGKSKECILSLLKAVEYAKLGGVALVSGDLKGLDAKHLFDMAIDFDLDFKVCTLKDLDDKISKGATHAITQPIFDPHFLFPSKPIKILRNLMPIFSRKTFENIAKNQSVLGFEIPNDFRTKPNLFQANEELLKSFEDFYLTPLNLKKQMKFFKDIFKA